MFKLPKPTSWIIFEDLVYDLFSRVFNVELQKYGRQGQSQYGVDIIGMLPTIGYVGLQCKNTTKLTQSQILNELSLAMKCPIKLNQYMIITTAENDVSVINFISSLNESKKYHFKISYIAWEGCEKRLIAEMQICKKYYPYFFEKNYDLKGWISKISSTINYFINTDPTASKLEYKYLNSIDYIVENHCTIDKLSSDEELKVLQQSLISHLSCYSNYLIQCCHDEDGNGPIFLVNHPNVNKHREDILYYRNKLFNKLSDICKFN